MYEPTYASPSPATRLFNLPGYRVLDVTVGVFGQRSVLVEASDLVDGLLIALLDIDKVIQVIRTSDDAGAARERLMSVFDLTELQ